MAIVSSVLIETSPQRDGRFWSGERHTDQLGLIYEFRYLAAEGTNATTVMTGRVGSINADLTAREIAANLAAIETLGAQAAVTFSYSTAAQNAAAVRAAYQSMTQTRAIFTGEFLGALADVQLETAFGLTQAQVTTLRTNKLIPATTAAATIRASAGQ